MLLPEMPGGADGDDGTFRAEQIPCSDPNANRNPGLTRGSSESNRYFILKYIPTEMKPTSLIQISQRHIAVATGFLNENSTIEILNIFTGQQISILEHHEDMIDSMRLVDLS